MKYNQFNVDERVIIKQSKVTQYFQKAFDLTV